MNKLPSLSYLLAALSWMSVTSLAWLLIFRIVPADLLSGSAFLFFFLLAVIASSMWQSSNSIKNKS